MKEYLDIPKKILAEGHWSDNRTGIPTIRISGYQFVFDMSTGKFPLLTTKKMGLKNICTELEFFIKGYTDKKWLQDRKCHIWDQWSNQKAWKPLYKKKINFLDSIQKLEKNPYFAKVTVTEKTKEEAKNEAMMEARDLGPIYGYQWRHKGSKYKFNPNNPEANFDPKKPGIDQLKNIIETAKNNPNDRRMIVDAWNPLDQAQMALPPCHYNFQILVHDGILDLIWTQRSCDTFLGIPYNIASYAMLLLLIAKETNLKPGLLIGEFHDVHIYQNHIKQIKKQLSRTPYELPEVEIPDETWNGIFNWQAQNFILKKYMCHETIKAPVAR